MKRQHIYLSVIAFALLSFACILIIAPRRLKFNSYDSADSFIGKRFGSPANGKSKDSGKQGFLEAFAHPISLHGIVIDQFDNPVAGATVEIFVTSEPWEDGAVRGRSAVLTTDGDGKFHIADLVGSSIGASAMKEGYLRLPPLGPMSSSARIHYSSVDKSKDPHADASDPVVLKLLKLGAEEPIIHVAKKRWSLPIDGTPRLMALDSESGLGDHQLEFRFWTQTQIRDASDKDSRTQFDWRFEVRIPGGGFVWDRSDTNFIAPTDGFRESIRYVYDAAMPRDEWQRYRNGRYFVRFADGSYGRVQFMIDGGSDNKPLYMESWINQTPGSTNLATDTMIINVIDSVESR